MRPRGKPVDDWVDSLEVGNAPHSLSLTSSLYLALLTCCTPSQAPEQQGQPTVDWSLQTCACLEQPNSKPQLACSLYIDLPQLSVRLTESKLKRTFRSVSCTAGFRMAFVMALAYLSFTQLFTVCVPKSIVCGGQRTTLGVSSLLPPCAFQRWNLACQAWWQELLLSHLLSMPAYCGTAFLYTLCLARAQAGGLQQAD